MVGKPGLEPGRLAAHDPKSCSSTNSDTSPRTRTRTLTASRPESGLVYQFRHFPTNSNPDSYGIPTRVGTRLPIPTLPHELEPGLLRHPDPSRDSSTNSDTSPRTRTRTLTASRPESGLVYQFRHFPTNSNPDSCGIPTRVGTRLPIPTLPRRPIISAYPPTFDPLNAVDLAASWAEISSEGAAALSPSNTSRKCL